jgi:outer membrane receptor protein involved in Fe transport
MKAFVCTVGVAGLVLCGLAWAEEPAGKHPVALDIEAQPMDQALNAFAQQAGLQLLFRSDMGAEKLSAPRVVGRYTADAALKRLLAGSGLTYRFLDAQTVTLVPVEERKTPAQSSGVVQASSFRMARVEEVKAEERPGEEAPSAGKDDEAQSSDEPAREVVVTGTRIRGLLGEQSTQPVLTITREDIDRYGISSIGEIFSYIPQVTSSELGQVTQTANRLGLGSLGVASNRVTATLRGAPAGGTLILVNGRRLPKTGLADGGGNDGYDIGGVPLAAVERIEVLLDGASAVYGADAVGGVINVILRKDYQGTEAQVRYEDTHDRVSSVKNLALTHGFAKGGFSGMLSASWEEAETMGWSDRSFLRTFDRRSLGGIDWRPGFLGGTGFVYDAFGLLDDFIATIPAGADGVNLTIEDFSDAGPLPPPFDQADFTNYATPYERKSAMGSFDYEFTPALTGFVQARWGESRTWRPGLPIWLPDVLVFEDYPGNPFGVPLGVTKVFYDLRGDSESVTTNRGLTAGLRGRLPGDWRFEAGAHRVNSSSTKEQGDSFFSTGALQNALFDPDPPLVLYDSTSGISPNPPGTLEAFLSGGFSQAERTRTQSVDFQADGSGWMLPAGELRMSAGAEYRDERAAFPLAEPNISIDSSNRYTSGYFAELRVPLVAGGRNVPLVNALELSLAVRHDRYSDFPAATNPRYGLLYRPFDWLMLRVSRGKGYKVPTLSQLYAPQIEFEGQLDPGFVVDPARGNEPVFGQLSIVSSGNPDLRPEHSRTTTAGVVLEAPFIEGLSLSFDYYDMEYLDRVSPLFSLNDLFILFPDLIIRADENLPGDPADWLPPAIGYIDIPQNVSFERLQGYDVSVNYQLSTRRGDVTGRVTASETRRQEFRSTPLSPVNAFPPSPMRLNGSLFWTRGPFGAGTVFTYAAPNAPFLPSSRTRWDVQGSYDFSRRADAGAGDATWWRRTLDGTRIDLTIFNVLNDEPPLFAGNPFRQPDNSVIDSRMLRFALKATAKF